MIIPQHLRYTTSHQWVERQADGLLKIGITDFAQEQLGDVMFLEMPAIGATVTTDKPCAVVESLKTASEVFAPVAGTILLCHDDLSERPGRLNSEPYEAWICVIKPFNDHDYETLLGPEDYFKLTT